MTGRGGIGTQPCGACNPCRQCAPFECWDPQKKVGIMMSELEEIARRAAVVAAEHDELIAAKQSKRKAQVELLRAVVEAVRPALPALCSRMPNIPGPIIRALNVANNLYLGESGGWIAIRDGGFMLLRRTSEEVAEEYVTEDIADALSAALMRHAGSREWSTGEIRREAERLRAATLLLKAQT